MLRVGLTALTLALTGCAMPKREMPVYNISVPFDEAAAAIVLKTGSNTIKGNAFLRQRGGGVVTCAGSDVMLWAATGYAEQRALALYGNTAGGFNPGIQYRFEPDEPKLSVLTRKSICDSQGNFTFEGLADGAYYVATRVAWHTGASTEGGFVARRVAVAGGKQVAVVLSQ